MPTWTVQLHAARRLNESITDTFVLLVSFSKASARLPRIRRQWCRVRAANSVLDHSKQAIEIEDVEIRVAALEQMALLSKPDEPEAQAQSARNRLIISLSITLLMPNGNTVTLRGGGDYALDLLACAYRGARTPEIELIAQSISSTERGGGHLVDLTRAILNSATEDAP